MIPILRRMPLEKFICVDAHINSLNLQKCLLCILVSSIMASRLKGRSTESAETQFWGTFNPWNNALNKLFDLLYRRLNLSVAASKALPNNLLFSSTSRQCTTMSLPPVPGGSLKLIRISIYSKGIFKAATHSLLERSTRNQGDVWRVLRYWRIYSGGARTVLIGRYALDAGRMRRSSKPMKLRATP